MLNCPLIESKRETKPTGEHPVGWIFELDGQGTVSYVRALPGTISDPAILEAFGFNFFEDIDGLEDMPELRHRFRSFISSLKANERFCLSSANAGIQTKVSLTKAFRTGNSPPSPLVMMEIRNEQMTEHLGGLNGNTTFKLRKK